MGYTLWRWNPFNIEGTARPALYWKRKLNRLFGSSSMQEGSSPWPTQVLTPTNPNSSSHTPSSRISTESTQFSEGMLITMLNAWLLIVGYGRVIDGADSTLDAMERVPVTPKNRPTQEIRLKKVWPTNLIDISVDPTMNSGYYSRKSNRGCHSSINRINWWHELLETWGSYDRVVSQLKKV